MRRLTAALLVAIATSADPTNEVAGQWKDVASRCWSARQMDVPADVVTQMHRAPNASWTPLLARSRYLELLHASVTGAVHGCAFERAVGELWAAAKGGGAIEANRYPVLGVTMASDAALENVRVLLTQCDRDAVPGAFMETGTWRGGASLFALGALEELDEASAAAAAGSATAAPPPRRAWLADSFAGLPLASTNADDDRWHNTVELRVSEASVRETLRGYGFLRGQRRVDFVPGFFNESLPRWDRETAPGELVAVLRIDADMYESTLDVLFNVYGRVAAGGFVIIDDWGIAETRLAVRNFFIAHDAPPPTLTCASPDDCTTAYWRKHADAVIVPDRTLYDRFCASRTFRSGQSIRVAVAQKLTDIAVTATRRGAEIELTVDGEPLEDVARTLCAENVDGLLSFGDTEEVCVAEILSGTRAHFDSPQAEAFAAVRTWF